jgi:Fe-S cluster assembly iron-binding protein IscA
MSIDIVALRAKLREYDQTLPRCTKRIVRVSNHAPDYVSEEERGEWEMRLSYPCSDLEGHEGQCREGRAVLGWPGFATLTALLDEAQLAAERLAALLDAERENTALRALLDAKSHEAGLYARRMEQAQRSRDEAIREERATVVAWLRGHSMAPYAQSNLDYAATMIERGEHRREED